MSKFCSNCGNEINENADICLKCGVLVKKTNTNYAIPNNSVSNSYVKGKVPGKGISIAGMVLGIIAIGWAFISLLSIGSIESSLVSNYSFYYDITSYVVGFAFGYTLFSFIPSIIGLILSIVGLRKSKSGINITGLLLNIIALVIALIEFIYILTFI